MSVKFSMSLNRDRETKLEQTLIHMKTFFLKESRSMNQINLKFRIHQLNSVGSWNKTKKTFFWNFECNFCHDSHCVQTTGK